MAQENYSIANQQGRPFRLNLNRVLNSVVTNNSGLGAPNPNYEYQLWADESSGMMRFRDKTNRATWYNLWALDSDLSVSGGGSGGGSFTPTRSNLFGSVNAIVKAGTDITIDRDVDSNTLTINSSATFTPTATNIYPAVKSILLPGRFTTLNEDDTNNRISVNVNARVAQFTADVLYDAVADIIIQGTNARLTKDPTAHRIRVDGPTRANIYSEVSPIIQAGSNVTITRSATANTLTINSTATGGITFTPTQANIYPVVSPIIQAGNNITVTKNPTNNTITINSTASGGVTFTPSQANLYPSVSAIMRPGIGIGLNEDSSANAITVNLADAIPYSILSGTMTNIESGQSANTGSRFLQFLRDTYDIILTPPSRSSTEEVLKSRNDAFYWEAVNEVPDTPGTSSSIGHVLQVTGENDQDYAWRALPSGGSTFTPSAANLYGSVNTIIKAGNNITITRNSTNNTLTFASTASGGGGGGSNFAEPYLVPNYWLVNNSSRSVVVHLDTTALSGATQIIVYVGGQEIGRATPVSGQATYTINVSEVAATAINRDFDSGDAIPLIVDFVGNTNQLRTLILGRDNRPMDLPPLPENNIYVGNPAMEAIPTPLANFFQSTAPSPIAETASAGTTLTTSRGDHVHSIPIGTGLAWSSGRLTATGGGGGSFTPTQANIYPIVKAIMINGLNTTIVENDSRMEIGVNANRFTPSQANLFGSVSPIIQAGANVTVTRSSSANTLTIAAATAAPEFPEPIIEPGYWERTSSARTFIVHLPTTAFNGATAINMSIRGENVRIPVVTGQHVYSFAVNATIAANVTRNLRDAQVVDVGFAFVGNSNLLRTVLIARATAPDVENLDSLTQAQYDAITTKDARTLYLIPEE